MRIALGLEYHGGGYCGWQTQPNGCGIQDVVQRALSTIAEQAVEVLSAGRTDTGVHAIEQVIHFETSAVRPLTAWVRGANANLPNDIAVLWAHPVPNEFHARYSARSRSYRYVLLNRPQRAAAAHARVGWFHQPLDVEIMGETAQELVGRHDFSAFRSSECQAKTPIKT
ncbi:MAG: tRNA pseudouridine(38-40) synthase TruA, partial [Burkholderiales bacterium]|nr:tRNA pseudouridine(38-40) synthase TruA [Burkholderiales bacterium]